MLVLKRKEFTSRETKDFMMSRFPKSSTIGLFNEPRKHGYHNISTMTGLSGAISDYTKLAKDKNGRLAEVSLNKYLNRPISQRLKGFKASDGKQLQLPANEKGSKKFLKAKSFGLNANSAFKKIVKNAPKKDVGVFRDELDPKPVLTYEQGYGLAPRREKLLLYN